MKMNTWKLLNRVDGYPISTYNTIHGQYQVIHQPPTRPNAKQIARFHPHGNFLPSVLGEFDTEVEAKTAAENHNVKMCAKYGTTKPAGSK